MKEELSLGVMFASAAAVPMTIPAASWREAPFDPCHAAAQAGEEN
jgi:hypothetical protein